MQAARVMCVPFFCLRPLWQQDVITSSLLTDFRVTFGITSGPLQVWQAFRDQVSPGGSLYRWGTSLVSGTWFNESPWLRQTCEWGLLEQGKTCRNPVSSSTHQLSWCGQVMGSHKPNNKADRASSWRSEGSLSTHFAHLPTESWARSCSPNDSEGAERKGMCISSHQSISPSWGEWVLVLIMKLWHCIPGCWYGTLSVVSSSWVPF